MTGRTARLREGLLLLGILLAAGWLRWTYIRSVSLHVDEFITLRAARQILERGIPLLPTGNFYSHGLILSYVEAGIMAVFGFAPLLARLPALLSGLLTVGLTWWIGRKWFSPVAGLIAAAILAPTPSAIVWGGRARMYAPLQLFALLTVYFFWRSVGREGTRRDSALFALSFLLTLFHHAEGVVLLPGLALIALGTAWPELRQRKIRSVLHGWWQRGLIAAGLVCGFGVLVEFSFRRMGPPMVSLLGEGIYGPSQRTYMHIIWDWAGIRKALQDAVTPPAAWGWAICFGFGGIALLADRLFSRRRLARRWLPPTWEANLIFLYTLLGISLFILLVAADPSWKSPRYLFMLLPLYFLVVAAVIAAMLGLFQGKLAWLQAVGVGLVITLLVSYWPLAWAAAHEQVAAYDRAFQYTADRWQPEDAVMTFVPQAAILYLGQCDYLSVPLDYRGFAYQQDGRWLEGWDSIPLIDSAAGVAALQGDHKRLWFIVDEHRFRTRFAPGFTQAIWNSMEPVWFDGQVMVFLSTGPLPPPQKPERRIEWEGQIVSEGYAPEAKPRAGMDWPLILYWSAADFPTKAYSASIRLVDDKGTVWAETDGLPLGGVYPTNHWWPGETLHDRWTLSLPADLPPGPYNLEISLYDPRTMKRLPTTEGAEWARLGVVHVGSPPGLSEGTRLAALSILPAGMLPAWTRYWTLNIRLRKSCIARACDILACFNLLIGGNAQPQTSKVCIRQLCPSPNKVAESEICNAPAS